MIWGVALCLTLTCLWSAGCGSDEDNADDLASRRDRTTNVAVCLLRPDTLIQYSNMPAMAWREVSLSFQEGGAASVQA